MKIAKDTIVTLSFRATDAQGKVLEDGKTPRAYLHGGYGNTLPGIEKARVWEPEPATVYFWER